MWRPSRLAPSGKDLDDDHRTTTAWARRWRDRFGFRDFWRWCGYDIQQFPHPGEAGLAAGTGQQAIMADAMKSPWQDMQHEAADELIRGECHDLLLVGRVPPVVLVAEPQLCSTAVMPMRAPRCRGSAAIVIIVSEAAWNSRA